MEQEAKADAQPAPAKGKGGKVLLIVVLLIVVVAVGVGGVLFGAKLQAGVKPPPRHAAAAEAEAEEEEEEPKGARLPAESAPLEALIVDVKGMDGEIHHLKVGLTLELGKPVPEEEMKRLSPRARDAAITYLRSLTLDDIGTPSKFEEIRKEMHERISAAMGKGRVKRVLFTDFVAQ